MALKLTGRRRIIFNIISLLIVMSCIRLGIWQLSRAEEKSALVAERKLVEGRIYDEHQINFKHDTANQFKTVRLTGRFLNDKVVFIDNQIYQHQAGYDVMMPFETVGHHVVWVNRGWLPGALERDMLPRTPIVKGEQTIQALVIVPKKKAFRIGDVQDPQFPNRFQVADLPVLNQYFESSLPNSVMILHENNPGSLTYHYVSVVVPPERHTGYAVQWFGLAIIWLIFSVYANT